MELNVLLVIQIDEDVYVHWFYLQSASLYPFFELTLVSPDYFVLRSGKQLYLTLALPDIYYVRLTAFIRGGKAR